MRSPLSRVRLALASVLVAASFPLAAVGPQTVLSVASIDGRGFSYLELDPGDPPIPVPVSIAIHPVDGEQVVIRFGLDSVNTTADPGTDFLLSPASCVIPPGEASCVAEVAQILPDSEVEASERVAFWAEASDTRGRAYPTTRIYFSFTIIDNDSVPVLPPTLAAVNVNLSPGSITEPALAPEVFPFLLNLTMERECSEEDEEATGDEECVPPPQPPLYVRWWTQQSTAFGGDGSQPIHDYRDVRGEFFLAEGEFSSFGLIAVEVFSDELVEPDELFHIHVSVSLTPLFARASHFTFLVALVDSTPEFVIGTPTRPGGGPLLFREDDPDDPPVPVDVVVPVSELILFEEVRVAYGTQAVSGSAREGVDYTPYSGVHVLPVGESAALIRFADLVGDQISEPSEVFHIWMQLEGRPSTRIEAVIEIEDDDTAVHAPDFVTIEFGGLEPPFAEGDTASSGIPILLRLSEVAPQSDDLRYQLVTLDGTARGGEDYRPLDVALKLRAGELVSFDPRTPLLLHILPDRVPEAPEEHFYLALSATVPGLDHPLLSQLIRVGIEDDDHLPSVLTGEARLWLGAYDPVPCPDVAPVVELHEPPPGSDPVVYRVPLYTRLVVEAAAEGACETPTSAFETVVRLESPFAGPAAALGTDVSLGARSATRLVFQPVDSLAVLEVLVYADDRLEPDEHLSVVLSAGVHGDLRLDLRVLDFQKRDALDAARDASFVRVGRLIGSALTDALSARFSCARSAGCADPHRSDPVPVRNLLGRLASLAAPLAPADPGDRFQALAGSFGPPGVRRTRLQLAGRVLDDLGFQTSPSAWLPVRNPDPPNPWSTWFRTDYLATADTDPDGNRLDTDLLAFSGGVDRRLGMLNLGVLYAYAQASYGRAFDPLLAEAEAVPALDPLFRVSGAWHLVAPYVAVTPHERVRLWSTFGITLAGGFEPSLDGYLPGPDLAAADPAYRVAAAGGSVTAFRASSFIVDLEADAFRVLTSVPASGAGAPRLPSADRLRAAVRVGVPLDFTSVKRVTFGVGRRWDAGPDLEWIRGSDGAPGYTELLFDVRFAALRSRFSAALAGRFQISGWDEPAYVTDSGVRYYDLRSSAAHAVSAALRWGVSETPQGWSIVLRPRYGYPGVPSGIDPARSLWFGAVLPRSSAPASGLPASLDLEAHYVFTAGGRLVLSGSRTLVDGSYPTSRPHAAVRFDHGW